MSVNLTELQNAADSLQTAIDLLRKTEREDPTNINLQKVLRDGCIQRFEFCIELSWKISIRTLGLETKAPNPAIRDMLQNGLIDDSEKWFKFLIARNKTSHTYNEEVAKSVYSEVENLGAELTELIRRLHKVAGK